MLRLYPFSDYEKENKMAEFTTVYVQQVAANQNATLETDVIKSRCVNHRSGSGLICLANTGCDCKPARYRVFVKANIDIPTGGTVEPISLALSLNGEDWEKLKYTMEIVKDAICAGACPVNIAVVNPNTQTIEVRNLTVIVSREC